MASDADQAPAAEPGVPEWPPLAAGFAARASPARPRSVPDMRHIGRGFTIGLLLRCALFMAAAGLLALALVTLAWRRRG